MTKDFSELGVWSRTEPLTRQQQKNRQELFSKLQKEYNETHNTDILWNKMYPLLEDAVKSALCKVNGVNNFIEYWDEKVVDALDLLITRYIHKPDYNFRSLATLAYWAAVYASRKPNVMARDKDQSYEVLMNEKLMHEDHIVDDFYDCDYNDFYDYDYNDYTDDTLYNVESLY